MPFAKRQRDGLHWPRTPRELAQNGLVTVGLGFVAAVSGPFGTFYDLDLVARLGYWVGSFAAGWIIIVSSMLVLLPRLIGIGLPPSLAGVFLGALGALPLSLVVLAAEHTFRPNLILPNLALMYGYVALLAVPLTTGMVWANWHRSLALAPSSGVEPAAPPPSFLARIPAKLGRELLALEAEDHYVRVHTMLGNDLVLMRMADALTALEHVAGMQVHRSYWVARAAIKEADRTGRRLTLTLKNGLQVPVSRSHAPALKKQGWLAD